MLYPWIFVKEGLTIFFFFYDAIDLRSMIDCKLSFVEFDFRGVT